MTNIRGWYRAAQDAVQSPSNTPPVLRQRDPKTEETRKRAITRCDDDLEQLNSKYHKMNQGSHLKKELSIHKRKGTRFSEEKVMHSKN